MLHCFLPTGSSLFSAARCGSCPYGKPGPRLVESKDGVCVEPDPVNPFAMDQSCVFGNFEAGPEGLSLVSAK